MTVKIQVRCTGTKRCPEGYYIIINGERVHLKTRKLAIQNVRDWLKCQRIQIVTVREYQKRHRNRIAKEMEQ